jgi:hypothetical protein
MNVRQKLESMLVNKGMFSSQANEVMELAIPILRNIIEGYGIRFESDSDGYPNVIYNVLMMQIKPIALKWIDENKPMAWNREMFT